MDGNVPVLSIILRGQLAHFRQPDTSITQATYPFPPRPAMLGLLGSILGLEQSSAAWHDFLKMNHWVGLALLHPIRTVCAQMSLLGKGFLGGSGEFNRPTVVELVVQPHYRLFYSGPMLKQLETMLREGRSVYHTYLGAAFCLSFPCYESTWSAEPIAAQEGLEITVSSVAPQEAVAKVQITGGRRYALARATPYQHHGDRTFSGTCTLLYETSGQPLQLRFHAKTPKPFQLVRLSPGNGEVICLW